MDMLVWLDQGEVWEMSDRDVTALGVKKDLLIIVFMVSEKHVMLMDECRSRRESLALFFFLTNLFFMCLCVCVYGCLRSASGSHATPLAAEHSCLCEK